MARYKHLSIDKAALHLTVYLEKRVAGFSRYHQNTLGSEMREGSRALLMQVLRANNAGNVGLRRVSCRCSGVDCYVSYSCNRMFYKRYKAI